MHHPFKTGLAIGMDGRFGVVVVGLGDHCLFPN